MLRASLKSLKVNTEALIEAAAVPATARAETLSVQDFCNLANAYDELIRP